MEIKIDANLLAHNQRIAIVVSRFNDFITSHLLSGAKDCLIRHGLDSKQITVVFVPGAFELPLIAQKLAHTKLYDAIICLGAIIRGETPHFDYVASEAAKGIANVALKYSIPIIFGVLTTNTIEQALQRAGVKSGNKGWECALAAIEMCNIIRDIDACAHLVAKTVSVIDSVL